jgi:hypothetical protein
MAKYSKPDSNGESMLGYAGANKAKQIMDDNMSGLDQMEAAITSDKFGLATASARAFKAKSDDTMMRVVDKWPTALILKTLNDVSPKWAENMFSNSILPSDLPLPDKAGMEQIGAAIIGQPSFRETTNPDGTRKTFTLQRAKEIAQQAGAGPKTIGKLLDLPKYIADPNLDPPAKINLINAAFDPGNNDLLSDIDMDSKDARGNVVKGRYAVFANNTSESVANGIKSLGDQSLVTKWSNWAEKSFSKDLFDKDIGNLTAMSMEPGTQLFWNNGQGKEPLGFSVKPVSATVATGASLDPYAGAPKVNVTRIRQIQDTLDRLNGGIRSLNNVYKVTGQDVNSKVLSLFIALGYDPTNLKGDLPSKLVEAMKHSSPASFPEPKKAE